VVSLEHIKVIITTKNVLVMNPEDENVLPFITELKMKLTQPTLAVSGSYPAALNELASKAAAATSKSAAKFENLAALQMPFELKALEVCLDSVSDEGMVCFGGVGPACSIHRRSSGSFDSIMRAAASNSGGHAASDSKTRAAVPLLLIPAAEGSSARQLSCWGSEHELLWYRHGGVVPVSLRTLLATARSL